MKLITAIISFVLLVIGKPAILKAQVSLKTNTVETALFVPFNASQLEEPALLAQQIKAGKTDTPLILNIGAVQDIEGAKHIGPVSDPANLAAFKKAIADLPQNTLIVIYCGCCPFTKCPNIKPAFDELKRLGFTNAKVLDLPTNLKTNWIASGYPLASK